MSSWYGGAYMYQSQDGEYYPGGRYRFTRQILMGISLTRYCATERSIDVRLVLSIGGRVKGLRRWSVYGSVNGAIRTIALAQGSAPNLKLIKKLADVSVDVGAVTRLALSSFYHKRNTTTIYAEDGQELVSWFSWNLSEIKEMPRGIYWEMDSMGKVHKVENRISSQVSEISPEITKEFIALQLRRAAASS